MIRRALVVAAGTLLLFLAACGGGEALDPDLGGVTTREDASQNSFGLPAPGLTNEERRIFERGDSFFTQNWVTAPASTDARDGLGPTMNAQSCSSCHVRDGRGSPPDPTGAEARLGLLIRLSIPGEDPITGAPLPDPNYGGQFQDRSILGVPAEGRLDVTYTIVEGTYADGEPYELRAPTYELLDLAFGPLSEDILMGPRLGPQVIGMGLLESIPVETVLANADPDDADGDGISGRPNMVWDERVLEPRLGRFGWKANVTTIEQQVAGAFLGDVGVTSVLHPDDNCPAVQTDCAAAPNGANDGEPELTADRLASVTFYNRTLSVPAMRDVESDDVVDGSQLFADIGCASCHLPTVETGPASPEVLANQTIHPYTDLLLHDMGPGLADGRPDFEASGSEWRTPPLWGLGLIDDVNGERFLLHDGRARTIAEAILWHGGEGEASAEAFRQLSADERAKLLAFLEAL
ncbi:MAG: di-heme oxidoredictase family protein [Actinomycetota bacterium]